MNSRLFTSVRCLGWIAAGLVAMAPLAAVAQPSSTNIIRGAITAPGEQDVYTFSLANQGRYYFDALTNASALNWSLEGPAGLLINNLAFASSDAGSSSSLLLVPGFYRLTVDCDSNNTNSYAFRFVNLTAAALLTPGTVISNSLSPANETDLYQFTSVAGDRLFFDRLTALPSGNIWWRMIDPYGNEVFSTPFNDVNNITQRVAGTYTLLVEGYPGNTTPGPYSLSVVFQGNTPPAPFTGTPLAVGAIASGSLTSPSTNNYIFTLATGARLAFDTLTNSSGLQWSLEGPPGLVVNNRNLNNSDALQGLSLLDLPAGDYQLSVRRTSAGTTPYRFRLLDLAGATPLTPGTPVTATLLPTTESRLYSFNASSGARYYFNFESTNGPNNAYWRLVNPLGQVVENAYVTQDRGPVTLTLSGTYTLLVEGYSGDDPGSRTHTFNIVPVNDGVQTLVVGALTSGAISSPGQAQQYLFSLPAAARLHFDSRTNNSQLRWSLMGPGGIAVNNRGFNSAEYASQPLSLSAGDYTLTITGNGDEIGAYSFRLFDLASATPISPGTPVSSTLNPANESDAYRFNANVGSTVYFDMVNIAGIGSAYWRCFDPFGNSIFANFMADAGPFVLPATGVYTLLIDGHPSDTGVGNYSFNVRPVTDGEQTLALNTFTSGAIATPGQKQVFHFNLPGAATLYFDSRTNTPLRWSLSGLSGLVVNVRAFSSADYASPLLNLSAGAYTLTVTGSGDDTGGFAFVLRDLATAAPITPGTPFSATLDPGDETDVWRFTAAAGSRVYFDSISRTGLGSAFWRCFDPMGNPVFGNFLSDAGPYTLPTSGIYTLLVEGHPADPASGGYTVNVVPFTDSSQPLTLGSVISNSISLPGQSRHYTFTLPARTRLYFDSQSNNSLRWILTGPDGIAVNQRAFNNADYGLDPLDLMPGDYRLTVSGSGDDIGNFAFRLFDIGTAIPLTPGNAVGTTLNPGNKTEAYRFNATAGDRFFFDWISNTGIANTFWRLFDPYGRQLFGTFFSSGDAGTNRLMATGTYTLFIEGATSETLTGSYQFNVVPVGNFPVPPYTGTPLVLGTTINSNLATANTTNAFTFTLATPGKLFFDSLVNSGVTWSLESPSTLIVNNRAFWSSDGIDGNGLLDLPAANYRLTVTGTAGAYSFRLFDAATAVPFTPGTVVSNTITPARATSLHRFNATAGQRFFYDGRTVSGFGTTVYIKLYTPFGRPLFSQAVTSDEDVFTVPHTGEYLISVEGRYSDTAPSGSYSFVLLPVTDGTNTFSVGQTVNGAITTAGQQQFHRFTLAAPSVIFFDNLSNVGFTWTLTGPGITTTPRALWSSDSVDGEARLNLPAGEYVIQIDASGSETNNYAFRLLDASSAVAFTPGTLVNGSLAPGISTALYRFAGTAGAPLYREGQPVSGFTSAPWLKIYSPLGDVFLSSRQLTSDEDVFELPLTGSYLVAVEGRYNDTSTNGNFAFLFLPVTDSTNTFVVGQTVNGAINSPGQRQFHQFSLAAPTRVIFDTLTSSSLPWTLTGPPGVIVNNRGLWSSDSVDGFSLFDLPAGDYTILIDPSNDTVGSYAFRLIDAAIATPFTPGTPVNGTLAPGISTALHRFTANAGDRFYFDGQPTSGLTATPWVRIYAPDGQEAMSPQQVTTDRDTFTLTQSGLYLVAVEGRYTDTSPSGSYSFLLAPNPPQPPTPLFDTNVAPDLVVTGVAITPPSGLQSGQAATVSWTTRNNGTAATPGSFTERLTVRNTGTSQVIVNRTLFYDEAVSGSINPGATRNRQLAISLPDGPAGVGNLEVTVTTDTLNNIFEQNGGGTGEANNAASLNITTTLAPYPDLQVASLGAAPVSAWLTGSVVTVSWVTTNAGNRATSGSWTENLIVRNTNTAQVIANAVTDYDPAAPGNGDIPPAGFRLRSLNFTVPMNDSAYGAFEVVVTTDGDNVLFEHNAGGTAETNNTRSLVSASAPDLVVNGLTVNANPSALAGAELTIQWNTANQGNVPAAGVFYDRVTVRNTNTAEILLNTSLPYNPAAGGNGPIAPGGSIARQHTFDLPDGARSVGRLEVTVAADTFNQLVEHNAGGTAEANNSAQTSIVIAAAPYPDLVVTNIVAPATGYAGQPVPFIWTIRNVGTVPAVGPWSDHLFLSTDNAIGGDQFLTSVFFSGTLAPGASLTRTQQVTLPAFGTGNRWFVAEADASGVLFEERETNNTAIAAAAVVVPATLTLAFSPNSVFENAGNQAVLATLTRNSDATPPLVVTLGNNRPAKVLVPASVTIPPGASATNFFLPVVDDAQVDPDVVATITAQAAGHVNATNTLTIRENDSPRLTLALSAASVLESVASGAVTGRVTRNVNTNVALLINLVSSRPTALTVPINVTIPVGQTSAVFNLSPVNDDLVTGPRAVNIFASATGFSDVSAPIDVLDDDSVTLTLRLSDTNVAENAVNPVAIATITRSPVSSGLLRVRLGTNGGGLLQIPSEVTIPASQSAVSFNVNVHDDNLAYGAQTVSILAQALAVDGSPIAGASATSSIQIRENDGPTLGVSISAAVVEEGASTVATVSRNTPPTNSLTINLSAAPAGQVTLPASVVLAPGAISTNVTVSGVVDATTDGAVEVTVTATTAGYNPGSAPLTVTDIDVPDLAVLEVTGPTNALTDGLITAIWSVTNSGLATATAPWVDELYLATDAQGANAFIVARVTNSLPVVVGDSYEVARSFLLPSEPGTYWLLLRTDAGRVVTEGSERNNALVSAAIDVQPSYRATVSTTVDSALSGTPIPLTGRTYFSVGGASAPFRTATVRVNVGRVRRVLDVVSDALGNFNATFYPIPGEAGLYTIGADHPRVRQDPAQDQFILLGMSAVPWNLSPRLAPNVPTNGTIELRNLSPLPLSGVSVTAENLPLDFAFAGSITNTLAGDGVELLSYQISTTLATASQGSFNILVQTTEGARLRIPVNFTVAPPTAQLVANPSSLERGMLRGSQTLVSFDVINQGGVASGDLSVALPVVPWLSLISTNPIPSLPPGGRSTVVLALTPSADLPLTLYTGSLSILDGQGGVGVSFRFRAQSEARGDLLLTFTDENTYYAEGGPRVTNGTVSLLDPITSTVVTNSPSGTNGEVRFVDLPEGDYLLEASAPGHASVRGGVRIAPGTTTEQELFLTRNTVRYEWRVVPTEIEDHYRVVLQPLFETEVPQPELVVENPLIAPLVIIGQTSQFEIRLRNPGLIALQRVRVPAPTHPKLEITPLVTELEELPAQTTVTIPVTIRVKPEGGGAGGFQAASGSGCQGTECVVHMPIDTRFRCGKNFVVKEADVILQVVCVPDTGCQFQRSDVTRLDFMSANAIADRSEWECLLGHMNECQKARVRGYLRSGDFGSVDGPFGFGISDFCACGPPERIPQLFNAGCEYLQSLGFVAPGGCPGSPPPPGPPPINFGKVQFVAATIPGPCNSPFGAAGAGGQPGAFTAAAGGATGVCAKVRMELSQDVTMTRTAFRGTLVIENEGSALTGLQVNIDFRNAANQSVANLFAVRGPTLSGITAVDGSGVVAGGSSGSVEYLFVPTLDAAPLGPTAYYIGGTLRFIEDGRVVTVPLLAAPITVFPEARLTLDYFQQRDVFSDDPFTPELEPAEPFALGLRIRNTGAGAARNLRIQSGQPRIIENDKGLQIDFRLLGLRVGDETRTPTFDLSVADIPPGDSKVAIWEMASSLQGKFIDFRASFEHVDALGGFNLSLIEAVHLHELTHVVLDDRTGADSLPDFLVNGTPDPNNAPDVVYLSTGSNAPVSLGSNAVFDSPPATNDLQVQLTATMPAGWTYLRVTNPGPDFRLVSVRRSDGKLLRMPENAWTTDRTFPSSITGSVREKTLHLFDYNSTGIYTLTFGPVVLDTNAPSSTVTALAATSPASFALEWNGDDGAGGSGIAFFDIYVSVNGGAFSNWLARTTQRSALFDGVTGNTYAFYSRATDVAGNVEIAPASADAQTTASSVNTPPSLVPIADATIDEGTLFSVLPNAIDTDVPRQTLAYTLLQSPAGATIDGTGGAIRWQTGEAQGGTSNRFTYVVADNGLPSLSATQSFTVFVREVNAPPFFVDPASDIQVDEETLLSQVIAATDGDLPAQALTWTLAPGAPVGMSLGAATGLLQWLPGESRGPGEYPITVTVRDNGSPQQSASRLLRVIVREVNRAPDLAPIPTQAALVQTSLYVTNSATDPDIPAQEFFYSLAPGAPQGARINRTNGVFTWTPAASFARSTNVITVQVTDNGVPSLTSSRMFSVVVGDLLEARLGTGIVLAGQTGSVPVVVFTSVPATNATFTFEVPATRLGTFSLDAPTPPLGSATLQSLGGNRYRIRLGATAGQQFAGDLTLTRLRFVAATGQSSAFVRLPVSDVSGTRTDGQPVPRALGSPGRVAYLGPEPLLEALRNSGQAELHLYARPAPSHSVESTFNLNPTALWTPFWNGPVNNLLEVIPLSPTNRMQFFRARTP